MGLEKSAASFPFLVKKMRTLARLSMVRILWNRNLLFSCQRSPCTAWAVPGSGSSADISFHMPRRRCRRRPFLPYPRDFCRWSCIGFLLQCPDCRLLCRSALQDISKSQPFGDRLECNNRIRYSRESEVVLVSSFKCFAVFQTALTGKLSAISFARMISIGGGFIYSKIPFSYKWSITFLTLTFEYLLSWNSRRIEQKAQGFNRFQPFLSSW